MSSCLASPSPFDMIIASSSSSGSSESSSWMLSVAQITTSVADSNSLLPAVVGDGVVKSWRVRVTFQLKQVLLLFAPG